MLGRLIRSYLDDNGISQAFVCDKAGFSPSIFNAMLQERRKIVAQEYFKICDALGVSLDTFKCDDDQKAS